MGRRGRRAQELKRAIAATKPKPLCAYCAIRVGNEREHVVARCFFDKLTDREVTVPACAECNRGDGDGGRHDLNLDEEYVRNVFTLKAEADDHPVAAMLREGEVARSFRKSPKLRERFYDAVDWCEIQTDYGTFAPPQVQFTMEVERIKRVTRKIVRGLFFHKERTALSPDIVINVMPNVPPEMFLTATGMFRQPANQWYVIGKNVLRLKLARVGPDGMDRFKTWWMFVWYNCHVVLAATGPKEDLDGSNPTLFASR